MPLSALIGAWLAGALGGLHCLAMCGGFVTAMAGGAPGAQQAGSAIETPSRSANARRQVAYNAGRVTTYTALGFLAGGAGGELLSAAQWAPVQRVLYLLANLFLLGLALAIARRRAGSSFVQRLGHRLFATVLPLVRRLTATPTTAGRYAVGLAWGLVPCALTYSVLPIALFAGSATRGAAVMLAFGLGTLPNLLAATWLVAEGRRRFDGSTARMAAALVLAAFAGVGIWRALVGTTTLAQGPFCF
jgi:sulfite exporter TauE/SafE